ncbi:ABC transporter permease [uncultured Corynebacterium sp.]|uniref:ABC transporter permease n=1 Tax=uncultured Corynebacterium sp. TaxID=159447 RepID=UPI0025E91475|nr:hypothetical protein [uncultured Corynebacterium sp.]
MSTLIRLHLRTRRGFLLGWLVPLIAFVAVTPPAYRATYSDTAELAALAEPMRTNLGLRAMYGIMPEPFTFGAFTQWETGMWVSVLGSVMAVLLAVRLTRAAEDDGVADVVRSSGLTTRTPTLAAATVVVGACLALGAGSAVALLAVSAGLEGMSATGCLLAGAVIAASSAASGAVGLLAAQVAGTARAARTLGLAFVGVAYAVRAFADVRDVAWLRAASPLGWRDVVGPFSTDRAWPLLPMVAVVAATIALAVAASARRDLDATWPRRTVDPDAAGTVAESARATGVGEGAAGAAGHRGLGRWALRARLERPALIGWGVAIVLMTAFFMSMTGEMTSLLESSPGTMDLALQMSGAASLEGVFIEMMGTLLGILVACAAVQSTLSAHRDEKDGTLAAELSAGVPRPRPFLVAWTVSVAAVTLILAVAASLGAVAAEASTADSAVGGGSVGVGEAAAWALGGQWPATVAAAGIAVFFACALPRATWVAWLAVAWSGLATYFGGIFDFPDWLTEVSLFAHAPHGVDGGLEWTGALVLLAIGVGGALVGAAIVGKRDLVG